MFECDLALCCVLTLQRLNRLLVEALRAPLLRGSMIVLSLGHS